MNLQSSMFRIRNLDCKETSEIFTSFDEEKIEDYVKGFDLWDKIDKPEALEMRPSFIKEEGGVDMNEAEAAYHEETSKLLRDAIAKDFVIEYLDAQHKVIGKKPLILNDINTGCGFCNERETIECFVDYLWSFLKKGVWTLGIRFSDGKIKPCESRWPQMEIIGDMHYWKDVLTQEPVTPTLWFGIPNKPPFALWILGKGAHEFWNDTNDFDAIPWIILWGDYDAYNGINICMVMEYGIETPEEEFAKIKAECPVDLSLTEEQIQEAIKEVFIRKTSTENSHER